MKLKSRMDLSFNDITDRLRKGEMQIHKFPLGFIVTEIKQLPGERVLHVVWLGGERFSEWMDEAFESLKEFCRLHSCKAIEAHCRPGLAVVLRKIGFRTLKITTRVEL